MLNYSDPTITKWEVDEFGNKTSIEITNESKQIVGDKIVLEGLPDEYYRVQIAGFTEIDIKQEIAVATQFKVDYRKTGIVYFHPSLDGTTVVVNRYYSRGLVYFPAQRIWTKVELGEVTETLDDLLSGADTAISIINQLDTYVDDAKIELDSHTDLKEVELNNYTITKELQLNLYTESKEGDLDLYTINKQGELDSHLTLKQNELDAYTITKQTQLDNYVLNTNQPALDSYVTNTSKPEIDSHVLNKENDLDIYTTAKETQLNIYTGTKETQLDNYTSAREIQLDDYTTLKEGDLETYANLKLSDINTAIAQLPYIGLNDNWFEWDFNSEAYVDSGVSAIGPQGIQGIQGYSIEYIWNGTQLGVKTEDEPTYTYVDLKGEKGDIGEGLKILGSLSNSSELPATADIGDAYLINQELWVYTGVEFVNAGTIQGPQGEQGYGIEYIWNGTQLGIKREDEGTYTYVDLEGPQGPEGIQGPAGPIGESGITWRGTYVNGTDYVINDAVLYEGSSYRAIADSKDIVPTNTGSWMLLASKGAAGGMDPAIYDPALIQNDVFNMANMVESTDAKILTATERTNIVNLMGVRAVIGVSPPADSILWIDTN